MEAALRLSGEGSFFHNDLKMNIAAHSRCVLRLLRAWETNVHSSLGCFPDNFQTTIREHVRQYLSVLQAELQGDLNAVTLSLADLSLPEKYASAFQIAANDTSAARDTEEVSDQPDCRASSA